MHKFSTVISLLRHARCRGSIPIPALRGPQVDCFASTLTPSASRCYSAASPSPSCIFQTEALSQSSRSSPNGGTKRLADFDLAGRTFIVTGGAQGLGLALAEGLVEAGGNVHCLDRSEKPSDKWLEARSRVRPEWGGALHYCQVDVTDTDNLNRVIRAIGKQGSGIHGAIAAAGIQQMTPAMDYTAEDARKMLDVNYTGVFMTATAVARAMVQHNCRGSICMIGSISGGIANRGLITPVYNSSKAAVVQLARNLAMEWAEHGIRVNSLSPGHLLTPMVQKNFEEKPELEEKWKKEIMLGRLADPSEFRGAALFLLSNASSFMTGGNLIVDGGHTAW